MATTATALVTVEQFLLMDDPPGFRLELHNGEVVEVTRPKYKHAKVQFRLANLINSLKDGHGVALVELAFRAKPEFELRVADVGWLSPSHDAQADRDDHVLGSPELVVEVLSPSNTVTEMLAKRTLCLSTGCQEFWLVDPTNQLVEVHRSNGSFNVYKAGDRIPMDAGSIAVNEIF